MLYGATFSLNCNKQKMQAQWLLDCHYLLGFGITPFMLVAMPKAASYASLEWAKPYNSRGVTLDIRK
jgi:hypothetical protein